MLISFSRLHTLKMSMNACSNNAFIVTYELTDGVLYCAVLCCAVGRELICETMKDRLDEMKRVEDDLQR